MDRLGAMRHFIAVAESGTFSGAARSLGLSNGTITHSIKNLEQRLGVRLINRNTRGMTLTCEGQAYAERCRKLLDEIDRLDFEVSDSASAFSGDLRIGIPPAIGHTILIPNILEFSRRYPDLRTRIILKPNSRSLIESGADVAVQMGELEDSTLVARRAISTKYIACAASSYISRAGAPSHPRDLLEKECLVSVSSKTAKPMRWFFSKDGENAEIAPIGNLQSNSLIALTDLASEGAGIIYIPEILVRNQLASGALVQLLTDWQTAERGIYVVYHSRQNLSEKVRAFVDYAVRLLQDHERIRSVL